jgi:uncharacterized protein (DUF2336 family)
MSLSPSTKHDDTIVLTREDVERLLRDDSEESRTYILDKVAGHYNTKQLSGREQTIAEEIFRLLMRDISTRVRETLADHMKDNEEVPRDIVLHLANDIESVAIPVIKESKVLSDADLVRIVEDSEGMNKLLAVSNREKISPRVSDALVGSQYSAVVTSLLSNAGASINEQTLQHIADEFARDQDVMQAMIEHPNLPITVVERLVHQASDAVASELKEKYQLTDSALQANATKVREEFMLRLLEGDLSAEEMTTLVKRMEEDGSLTPSIIMTALCRGQLAFFTVAVAHIARVSYPSAQRLLADRGIHGFNGIYAKSGLPPSMAEAVRLLLRAVQELEQDHVEAGTKLYANRLVARVVDMAGDQTIDYLPYFIALIRQSAHRK